MDQQAKAPPEIQKAALFLRSSSSGMKIRVGALNGKRLDYFKGKAAIKALLSPAYQKTKGVRPIASEEEAKTVLSAVNAFAFFLRVARGAPSGLSANSPKNLTIIHEQMFSPDEYYAWFYEGSQWTTYAGGILMVILMLAGVMFPLWPPVMRLGVWYLSIGMLGLIGLFFAIAVVRLIFYVITIIVASPGIWIFPKLFADVGFVESFIPLWEWDEKKKPKKKAKDKGKEKAKGKGKERAKSSSGASHDSAYIEEVEDSGDPNPLRRAPRIQEVQDEDA